MNHVEGALDNYRRLARYNGLVGSIRYLFFEMIGRRKLIRVLYAGHPIFVRTCSPDLIVAYWCLEGHEFDFLKDVVDDAEVIVDGGSYVGFAALALARLFPKSRIFAVEPDPENFDLLVRNTTDTPNIVPIHCALMAESGTVTLFDPKHGEWGFSAVAEVGGAKRTEILGISVRDLMEKFNLSRIDVLKLDVEGAEKRIFENSKDWIASVVVIYAELHERLVSGTLRVFFRATKDFNDLPMRGEKVCTINPRLVAHRNSRYSKRARSRCDA